MIKDVIEQNTRDTFQVGISFFPLKTENIRILCQQISSLYIRSHSKKIILPIQTLTKEYRVNFYISSETDSFPFQYVRMPDIGKFTPDLFL